MKFLRPNYAVYATKNTKLKKCTTFLLYFRPFKNSQKTEKCPQFFFSFLKFIFLFMDIIFFLIFFLRYAALFICNFFFAIDKHHRIFFNLIYFSIDLFYIHIYFFILKMFYKFSDQHWHAVDIWVQNFMKNPKFQLEFQVSIKIN
jgi:hypothetical protein